MDPFNRVNKRSSNTNENYKHLKTYKNPDTLKNFYYDAFNSFKQNQIDYAKQKKNVSNNKIFKFKIFKNLEKICFQTKR